ncbi:hypothetical protein FSARC_14979 [Fusarium sarcochroum]|uniref:Uncharacterized protein n=1 Tax=Fusarium sarcochroum TaxID=1208366 RepID=A0A8H4WMM5_9HYPO|nr:hypothetical protein FSARC_14979 [Fusarium sarcochroum]
MFRAPNDIIKHKLHTHTFNKVCNFKTHLQKSHQMTPEKMAPYLPPRSRQPYQPQWCSYQGCDHDKVFKLRSAYKMHAMKVHGVDEVGFLALEITNDGEGANEGPDEDIDDD